jgi:hypothetical protein
MGRVAEISAYRPAVGAHRKRQSKADYVATVDYVRVVATG